MNIRLTDTDQTRIRIVQAHFSNLAPVSLSLSNTEVVRLSLRNLVETLAASDDQVTEQVAALEGRGGGAAKTRNEEPGALVGEDRARRYNWFFHGLVQKLQEGGFENRRKAPSRSWYNFSAGHGMNSKVQYSASFNRDAKARVELYVESDMEFTRRCSITCILSTRPSKRTSVKPSTGRDSTTRRRAESRSFRAMRASGTTRRPWTRSRTGWWKSSAIWTALWGRGSTVMRRGD